MAQQVKDPALSLLWLGLNPWPGQLLQALGIAKNQKKKKKKNKQKTKKKQKKMDCKKNKHVVFLGQRWCGEEKRKATADTKPP